MPSVRLQNTTNGSTPNPKRTNQTSRSLPTSKSSCITITVMPKADHSKNSSSFSDSKHFFCSTCHKYVFNANRDACITKLLNEVNSRKVKSHKTKNNNNPVEQKSRTLKPGRQIFSGHRFSPKKTFIVYEKTSPRSCLRWKPTGKIFITVGLKWIPTGKLLDSCTSKVDSEPPNCSNDDITNSYKCDQTLNVSAAVEASKRISSLLDHKIQKLSKGLSEGSGIIPEVPDKLKDNSEVAEKQAGSVQTSLTLSYAKLEIQSMVDVPIHQEDPAVQRTSLIDIVILMVTNKTASTPTPPNTQAQVQICSTSLWKDSSRES
ncbi:hypothetical protein Tco_1547794 [Tanacetum coccineum]